MKYSGGGWSATRGGVGVKEWMANAVAIALLTARRNEALLMRDWNAKKYLGRFAGGKWLKALTPEAQKKHVHSQP